jgi:hypothetical protein
MVTYTHKLRTVTLLFCAEGNKLYNAYVLACQKVAYAPDSEHIRCMCEEMAQLYFIHRNGWKDIQLRCPVCRVFTPISEVTE